ncbi:CsbD family protein [Pseudoalteromonas gelatinilytica]
MNSDRLEGNWKELEGKAQRKWGDLTNDDLDKIEGSRKELVGKLQQKYGKSKEEAEREVSDFEKSH